MAQQNKIKVLFLPKWYPEKNFPILGIFIKKHAEAVSRHCDVAVLYVNSDPTLKNNIFDVVKTIENNIFTIRVYYKKVNSNFPFVSSIIKLWRYFNGSCIGYKIVVKEFGKPNLAHLHIMAKPGVLALPLKIFKKIPFIITEHWSGYLPEDGSYKGFLKKIFTKILAKNSSGITTVSENLKKSMMSHGLKNNYWITRNVVDINIFRPNNKRHFTDRKRILHISILDERSKNISGLLNAAKALSVQRNDFELHLAGEGPDRKQAEILAQKLNLKNTVVFFLGHIAAEKIPETIINYDFFILPSNYDNCPCVLIEALSCGLPVIATKVGGIPELLNEDCGILIDKNNPALLEEALNYMIDNYQKYDRQKLNLYAQNNFSYEVIGKKFFEIYHEVLAKK